MRIKNLYKYSIIFFAFCVPIFNAQLGSAGNIIINGGILLILLPILFFKKKIIIYELRQNNFLKVFTFLYFFYFLIIIFSLYVGAFQIDSKLLLRDFYEFHKPILFISIIYFIYLIYLQDSDDIDFSNLLNFIFIILTIFAFLQINKFREFSLLYIDINIYDSNRLTLPFGNPYDYAFVIIFFCFFYFYKSILINYKYILYFIISIYLLVETGSRSNAFGFLLVFTFFIPISILFSSINIKKKLFFIFNLFFILITIFFLLNHNLLPKNFFMIYDQFSDFYFEGNIGESGSYRLEQFHIIFERALDNPSLFLFGNGPAKGLILGFYSNGDIYYSEHLESALSYIFFRYGLFGLILFTSIYIMIFKLLLINTKYTKNIDNLKIFNLSVISWIIFIPLSSIGGMYMEQPRSSFFFYLIIGLCLILNRKLKSI